MGIPAIRQALHQLTSDMHPRPLPNTLMVQNAVMAPGVEIRPSSSDRSVGPFELRSLVGFVDRAPGVVTVREPLPKVSAEARRLIRQSDWLLGDPGADGAWQLEPPLAFRDAGWDPSADSIRESTVTALAALSRLMPPGLETSRVVRINDADIGDARLAVMIDAIKMCDGLGLGAVTLLARNQTVPIGTTVPIFIGAKLLTDKLTHPELQRTILDYLVAVMTRGAPPFQFHLAAGSRAYHVVKPDTDGAMRTEAEMEVRSFLNLMALDPRLDSGAGIGLIASAAAGVALLMGGLFALTTHEGATSFDATPLALGSLLLGSAWTAGSGWLGHRRNANSATPPAVTTDFTLTAWPDALSPSTHTLTRRSSSEHGSAMRTQVT